MKMAFCALLVIAGSNAMAGWDCKSADGKTTLNVAGLWWRGAEAELDSPDVKNYYAAKNHIRIGKLVTVLDPETNRAISEEKSDGIMETTYSFMQRSENKRLSSVWNLEFQPSHGSAILVDQEGKQFKFNLICSMTPDLQ